VNKEAEESGLQILKKKLKN